MHGFYNMALRINLSQRSFDLKIVPDEVLRASLGGKGLATHLLLKHNPPGVDPLAPENHLIFAIGPTTGTGVWGSCRYGVFTKSPQTGFYSESYSGGAAAEYLAASGFDAVMIHGASEEPVWLEVNDETVHFHPAGDLWGLDTYQTEDRIKDWIKQNRPGNPQSAALVIGPAGENLVRFAAIENEHWRSAGRTGVGTVMGSKKIKAIAFWGRRRKELAHPQELKEFSKSEMLRGKEDKGVNAYRAMGTTMMVDIMDNAGSFPTHYWHQGQAAHRQSINAAALHDNCQVTPHACKKCYIACGRMSVVQKGRHAGLKLEGPEYETIYAFGGLCEVDSIEEIIHLNDICDRLGMDTISAGNLAALAIEASRQGRIDLDIDYGQVDKIAALLEDIAARRGLGRIMGEGIVATAKAWGMQDQAIHVKGLEPAGYDPRVLKGMGLAYGTSDRGPAICAPPSTSPSWPA
ncbi:MAG: aldehyde ferredoxin oxidoreductase N-terminal domain-containing protein [Pseudomonadota bacterium]